MSQSLFVNTNTHIRTHIHTGTHEHTYTLNERYCKNPSFVLYANLTSGINVPQIFDVVISFAHVLFNLVNLFDKPICHRSKNIGFTITLINLLNTVNDYNCSSLSLISWCMWCEIKERDHFSPGFWMYWTLIAIRQF